MELALDIESGNFGRKEGNQDRVTFFNRWSPQIDEKVVDIVAEDFNVNLDLYENRISQAKLHNDPS
ncbi:3501_t:CDS:2, partial [Gigaspora rosea]